MCFQKVEWKKKYEKIRFENILKVSPKYKKPNYFFHSTFLKSVKYFKKNYKSNFAMSRDDGRNIAKISQKYRKLNFAMSRDDGGNIAEISQKNNKIN